jgi:hypothetical protein
LPSREILGFPSNGEQNNWQALKREVAKRGRAGEGTVRGMFDAMNEDDRVSRNFLAASQPGPYLVEKIQMMYEWLRNVEHGGTWFHSPASTNWILEFRFENPSKQSDLLKRKLNFKPLIRPRIPNEASW